MPRITNLGDYPSWFMCCSSSTASYTSQFWAKQRAQLPPQFVLMREGGTCQPMLDRTVQTGNVYWDDEDDATTNCGFFGCSNNRNSASGNLPDGTYDQNTKIEFCTYSVSNGFYLYYLYLLFLYFLLCLFYFTFSLLKKINKINKKNLKNLKN